MSRSCWYTGLATLADLTIGKQQSSDWQKLARVFIARAASLRYDRRLR